MLLNIDGDDSKLSCELHYGQHSWVGAATDGGYLGADAQSFLSSVVSGAARVYILALTADAGISSDMIVHPGQDVRISGDPGLAIAPSWGSGGFTVQERGSLSLSGVVVTGRISVQDGSTVSVSGGSVLDITTAFGGALRLNQVKWQGQTQTGTAGLETSGAVSQCFSLIRP
jgi:hypothetical protein|eukprot:COSAG02_NODE_78_length_40609_cov_19.893730_22_plen_172_part_00